MSIEEAIKRAGTEVLKQWPGNPLRNGKLEIQIKKDGSPVTSADLLANEILTEAIRAVDPSSPILSEESPPIGDFRDGWVLDPIDGTQIFIDGRPDFAILAARVAEGAVVEGYLGFPAQNRYVTAKPTQGAFLNGIRLSVSQHHSPRAGGLVLRYIDVPETPLQFNGWLDGTISFVRMCEGLFDGVALRFQRHSAWDYAPVIAMVRESGGTITDEHGSSPVISGTAPTSRYLIASNGKVHTQLLELIRRGK